VVGSRYDLGVGKGLRLGLYCASANWYTKKIFGFYAAARCTTQHWLAAMDKAVNRQFPSCVGVQGSSFMSDRGCQPAAIAFMGACAILVIH
jgi:transposase InsO family protein